MWRHIILIGSVLAGDRAAAPSLPLPPGRTTDVTVAVDVGAPLERAVASKYYAQAAAADAEQRWADATALYREAVSEWTAAARVQPSRALELAAAKAERERQRSQLLASRALAAQSMAGGSNRFTREPYTHRADALDEGRLLRAKMMAARAVLERVPAALYARTRDRLRESLRAGAGASPTPRAWAAKPRSTCCSARPTPPAARSRRRAWRARTSPRPSAPTRPTPSRWPPAPPRWARRARRSPSWRSWRCTRAPAAATASQLRDLYLANDWDRLRGDPKFESLFPR